MSKDTFPRLLPAAIVPLALSLTFCGGAGTTSVQPPPPPQPKVVAGAQFGHPGLGVTYVGGGTVAQNRIRHGIFAPLFNLFGPVDAGGASISGSYGGSCPYLPAPNLTITNGVWVPINGFGSNDEPGCTQWFTALPIGSGPDWASPAIGSGTLSTLVVYGTAQSGSGITDSDGIVTIFVNGQPTALTCTIGTSGRCEDTSHTVAVNDGDYVNAAIQYTTGAQWTGIKVIVLKQ